MEWEFNTPGLPLSRLSEIHHSPQSMSSKELGVDPAVGPPLFGGGADLPVLSSGVLDLMLDAKTADLGSDRRIRLRLCWVPRLAQ